VAKAPTEIRSLARSHTETALNTLVGIMNQDQAPHAARVAAANSLLDRGWGKPMQGVEMSGPEGGAIETITKIELVALTSDDSSADTASS
jgi:hypothetical protein